MGEHPYIIRRKLYCFNDTCMKTFLSKMEKKTFISEAPNAAIAVEFNSP
jgi:hypothetical protein